MDHCSPQFLISFHLSPDDSFLCSQKYRNQRSNREEKCDVTLPWRTTKMERFILAKQQLCSCITLFCTFLIRRNCDGEHLNFTRSLYGVCEHGAYIFFFFFQTQIRSLRIQPQKILPTFNKLNETE